jgi:rubrerythrin
MAKAFSELSEKEVLALAISLEEDDARIYVDYADRPKADFPNTAKLLTTMQHEELLHAKDSSLTTALNSNRFLLSKGTTSRDSFAGNLFGSSKC